MVTMHSQYKRKQGNARILGNCMHNNVSLGHGFGDVLHGIDI